MKGPTTCSSSQSNNSDTKSSCPLKGATCLKRNAGVFLLVVCSWLAFDIASKSWFEAHYNLGEVAYESLCGIVQFRLVHNTGAAWGMFGDSTFALGVFSLVLCVVLVVYLFILSPRASLIEVVGLSLVVAGGLGNALDRFTLGYVVDFIDPVFIDFPVFNIADIGVTCGFVLFVIGLVLRERREGMTILSPEDSQTRDRRSMPAGEEIPK